MIGADPALKAGGGDPEFEELMAEVLPLLDDNRVCGSDGAYGQSYSPLADGGSTPAPLDVVALDNSLLERVHDLRATLNELETMNRQGVFAGKLDLSRVALIGDVETTALNQLHKPTLLLMGGEDSLILQLAANMAKATGGTTPSPDNAYPVLHAVFAILENTNHASLSTAGPYWWPQLKPNTFPKFFNPKEEYQLTNAATAHRIQQEMILAFLDAMVRGDEAGNVMLKNNPWAEYNTQIELRQ